MASVFARHYLPISEKTAFLVKDLLIFFLYLFPFHVKKEGVSPLPGLVRFFEVLGFFGGGCFKFVAELLDGFSSGVAKFKELPGISEGERGVFFGELFGFAGLYDEAFCNSVIDEIFRLRFGFGGDAPAFQIDFFF